MILEWFNIFVDNIGNTIGAIIALPGALFGSS